MASARSGNLKRLFRNTLSDELARRHDAAVKTRSKPEKILRGLIAGAVAGDPRSVTGLLRLAQATGEFEGATDGDNRLELLFRWFSDQPA